MNLTDRQRAFALLVIKQSPENFESFCNYVPAGEKQALMALYKQLAAYKKSSMTEAATSELSRLKHHKSRSFLADVHDDWLVDLLKQESAPMVAAILRQLPSERVNAILQGLPKSLTKDLPKIAETYAIDLPLIELLQQRFEDFFREQHNLDQVTEKTLEFEHVSWLKAKQIEALFLELGYREIALGLRALPEEARKMVVRRLSAEDQQFVKHHLDDAMLVTDQRIKRAEFNLIHSNIHPHEQVSFVAQLGYLLYAKSLLPNDLDAVLVVKKKMSKIKARHLQDLIDSQLAKNTDASTIAYREDVVAALKRVAKNKR